MWGGPSAYINGISYVLVFATHPHSCDPVSFDSMSQGNLAMVIYEWADVKYLGKETISDVDDAPPVRPTSNIARRASECNHSRKPTSVQPAPFPMATVRATN